MIRSSRTCYWVHKWSSLLCTAFILVMCVTGLPLIFRDELTGWLRAQPNVAGARPVGLPPADLDMLIEKARGPQGLYPGQIVRWISLEDDRPEIWIGLAPSYGSARELDHSVKFDAWTGQALKPIPQGRSGFAMLLASVLRTHQDLLLGAAGEAVMMAVALLFLTAIVSGIILYAPFLRTPGFGAVRRGRNRRIRWLDVHNLIGIALAAWTLIVAATGLLNETSDIIYDHWKEAAMASALEPYRGMPMPDRLTSAQTVMEVASRAMPGLRLRSIRFPDGQLGSPQHYLVWAIGDTPLTSRLFQPALVDARTGKFVRMASAPWYLKAIQLSRPLHFGDYGGMPLKILWALFDVMTIAVLGSGAYLWIARPRRDDAREPSRGLPGTEQLARLAE